MTKLNVNVQDTPPDKAKVIRLNKSKSQFYFILKRQKIAKSKSIGKTCTMQR